MTRLHLSKPVLLVLTPGSSSIKWTVHIAAILERAGSTAPVGAGRLAMQSNSGAAALLTDVLANHDDRAVIEAMEAMEFRVTHVYGLTETYGPSVACEWKAEWDGEAPEQRARLKSRQGVRAPLLDGLMVADPDSLEPVPKDGQTIGEIMMRGNVVMKGYLKNPTATAECFAGGWFHSGDLAVWHADGYVEIKDRSKDIIISGGENISSIEVEDVLYRHPQILEAAVVAMPSDKWGETPCAFVTLKPGVELTAAEVIAFCQQRMARFKVPGCVVFTVLPKTSTGKVQKFVLREQARAMAVQ
jgi:fatty-acyl-CoA synthase